MADQVPQTNRTSSASLLDYLRLFRISNVFTAVADVTMGFLVAHATLQPVAQFVCLVVASVLLYTAGMVLNDVFDAESDQRNRPERPIPSGRISRGQAAWLGGVLLLGGVALGWLAGWVQPQPESLVWRSGAIASLLAACVLLYDAALKRTLAGPLAMGGCRLLNVLLGMSTGAIASGEASFAGFAVYHWIAAGGIGVYVIGITWFARDEAGKVRPGILGGATVVMMAGIMVLGLFHRYLPVEVRPPGLRESIWWMLLGLIALTILRRSGMAISSLQPIQVRLAVQHAIWTLIMLDAALAMQVTVRQGNWFYAIGIVALLIPTALLGRWIPAT